MRLYRKHIQQEDYAVELSKHNKYLATALLGKSCTTGLNLSKCKNYLFGIELSLTKISRYLKKIVPPRNKCVVDFENFLDGWDSISLQHCFCAHYITCDIQKSWNLIVGFQPISSGMMHNLQNISVLCTHLANVWKFILPSLGGYKQTIQN